MTGDEADADLPAVKVILLGSTLVGKTSIVSWILHGSHDPSVEATVGAAFSTKTMAVGTTKMRLELWDTAGQERFKALAPLYFRGTNCAIVTFSLTDHHSLSEVEFWTSALMQNVSPPPAVFVTGNKVDLVDQRAVEESEAKEIAERFGAEYWEVSAKTGTNMLELIAKIAEVGLQSTEQARVNAAGSVVSIQTKESWKAKGKCC
jgi:small GTP-binding protein